MANSPTQPEIARSVAHETLNPVLYLTNPVWMTELRGEVLPIYVLDPAVAEQAVAGMIASGEIPPRLLKPAGNEEERHGVKSFDGTVLVDMGHEYDNIYGSVMPQPDGTTQVARARNWLTLHHEDELSTLPGLLPGYAISIIDGVIPGKADELAERFVPDAIELGAVGSETELFCAAVVNNELVGVDVQSLLRELGKATKGLVSVEAWVSQLESVSTACLPGESRLSHLTDLAVEQLVIAEAARRCGILLLPTAVSPFKGEGQANYGHPHVLRAVHENLKQIRDQVSSEITIHQTASMLEKFGVSGLHITADLSKPDGLPVTDGKLVEVFNHTHGGMLVLLKSLTLNGNLGSADSISQRLSYREVERRCLPTARVGRVLPLFSDHSINAVIQGKSQALERAAMAAVDPGSGEPIPAGAVHNPLGRAKQTGRIEFTIWDVEPNLEKVACLEALMTLYTTAVFRSSLQPEGSELSLASEKSRLGELGEMFMGVMEDQTEFTHLSELIETQGFEATISIAGQNYKAGELIVQFINWVQGLSVRQGLGADSSFAEAMEFTQRLKNVVQDTLVGNSGASFVEYFDPQSEFYMRGNVAIVARNMYSRLVADGMPAELAHQTVLRELSEGYYWQLRRLAGK